MAKRTFISLENPDYRNLWISMLLQGAAWQMQFMARGYLTYELTGSAILLGVITSSAALPAIVFGLYGGVLADRINKKLMIQSGQIGSLLLGLFIAVSITTGTITWLHLMGASLVQGALMAAVMPARQSIVPQIVGEKRLMNAIGLNSMAMSLTSMSAPALAGVGIAVLGVDGMYYAVVGLYVAAIFFTSRLPNLAGDSEASKKSMTADLLDGLRYVYQNRVLLLLVFLSFSTMLLAMPIRFVLPVFAKDSFGVGSQGLGGMLSAIGVGSFVGALLVVAVGRPGARGRILAASGVISGGAIVGFGALAGFAPAYWVAISLMVVVGVMQTSRMTLRSSLLMEYADNEYRGRVMSIVTITMALSPAAALPIGFLVESIGAPVTVAITGFLLMLVSGAVLIGSPKIRALA